MEEFPDYYGLLRVPDTASLEDIKKAYRAEQKFWYPDFFRERSLEAVQRATEMSVKLNEAYAVLSDPERRSVYDAFRLEWEEALLESKGLVRRDSVPSAPATPPPPPQAPPATPERPGTTCPGQQAPPPAEEEIVLRFPNDYSVGKLWGSTTAPDHYRSSILSGQARIAEARGEVRVSPRIRWVTLELDAPRISNDSGRSNLPPVGIDAITFGGIHSLTFGSNDLDQRLAHLGHLTQLQSLDLSWTRVTDVGLAHLSHLTELKRLDLTHTQVTDVGLAQLSRLTQLQSLKLTGTPVTDVGLAHLQPLALLESLELINTKVTKRGLRRHPTLPQDAAYYLPWFLELEHIKRFIHGLGRGLFWALTWLLLPLIWLLLPPFLPMLALISIGKLVLTVTELWGASRLYGVRSGIWVTLSPIPGKVISAIKAEARKEFIDGAWQGSRVHLFGYWMGFGISAYIGFHILQWSLRSLSF